MKLILFGCFIWTICVDVGLLATNVTDSSVSPKPQFATNNELDRQTPDSKTTSNYATNTFADMPLWRFHPLARIQTRGMLFDEMQRHMNPFWEGRKIFGMPPLLRMALHDFFFGDDIEFAGRYPARYDPYVRYQPDSYTSPGNQVNAQSPGSPYYRNQFAQPNQPPPAVASPYYGAQPGVSPVQSQPVNQVNAPSPGSPYYSNQLAQPNRPPPAAASPYYGAQNGVSPIQSQPANRVNAPSPGSPYYSNQPNQPPPAVASPYYRAQPGVSPIQSQPVNQVNAPSPRSSNYGNQPNQPSPVVASPYYGAQSGVSPIQSQPFSTSEPYYRGQTSQSRIQTAPSNTQPLLQTPSSYYTEQRVQPSSVPTSSSSRNGEQGPESQIEVPSTLPNSRDQRTVPSQPSQPIQPTVTPNAHQIQPPKANEQPQYTAAG